jgi:hypothetical protein
MVRVVISSILLLATFGASAQNTFPDTGYVGLGTTTPQAPLDVMPTGDEVRTIIFGRLSEGNNNNPGTFLGVKTGTNPDWPRPFWIDHCFYGNTNATIGFYRGNSVAEGEMSFCTYNGVETIWFQPNGHIGLRVRYPSALLGVNGNITAHKAWVQETGWPDYVFQPSYTLLPLTGVAQYLKQYAHLPGVPSATVIEQDGLDIGSMQKILLKKIEETTLYLIELDKENKALQKENELLAKELDSVTVKQTN